MAIDENLLDALAVAATVVDCITDTNYASIASDSIATLNEARGGVDKYVPNPRFIQNGHAESDTGGAESPNCKRYFKIRLAKKIGGGLVSVVGNVGSIWTQVNVGAAAKHASSEAKNIAHLIKLYKMSQTIKQSEYLTKLINVLMVMKGVKAATQGGSLAAALIPNAIASGAVGIATAIGGKAAVKLKGRAVTWAALELHWRAFTEMKIGRGGTGPAQRMVRELFNQALVTLPFEAGAAGADKYILEPSGWMVIQDKLNLV